MSNVWHWLIVIVTLVSIVACLWLLFANARGKPGEDTTGHVWDDDLREYNNPLPRWWLNLFVLTVVFGLGYLWWYPGLGNYAGDSGWTQQKQLQEQLAEVQQKRQAVFAALGNRSVPDLAADAGVRSMGRELFLKTCAGCHGADARGALGFPNLADADWLYGGTPERIVESITEGRHGQMPAFNGAIGGDAMDDLVSTLRQWDAPDFDAARHEKGLKQFSITCAVCHGPEGRGNPQMGTPNLRDGIWLHGGSADRIRHSILFGRQSNMPAHKELLSADEVRVVSAYVLGLSQQP